MGWGPNADSDYGDNNYGDADSWGGPVNGTDVLQHIPGAVTATTARVPEDVYMFFIIVGSLAALWLLGGVAFKSARLS